MGDRGYARQVIGDLRKSGEVCGKHRVERIMREYKNHPHSNLPGLAVFGRGDVFARNCAAHNLQHSMSRKGKCWNNAVAECFFSSLKKERIRKRIYKSREMARSDIFDDIEVFYNRSRRHSHLDGISPEAFESAAAGGQVLSSRPGAGLSIQFG